MPYLGLAGSLTSMRAACRPAVSDAGSANNSGMVSVDEAGWRGLKPAGWAEEPVCERFSRGEARATDASATMMKPMDSMMSRMRGGGR